MTINTASKEIVSFMYSRISATFCSGSSSFYIWDKVSVRLSVCLSLKARRNLCSGSIVRFLAPLPIRLLPAYCSNRPPLTATNSHLLLLLRLLLLVTCLNRQTDMKTNELSNNLIAQTWNLFRRASQRYCSCWDVFSLKQQARAIS